MDLSEFIEKESKIREESIDLRFGVLKCIMELIVVLKQSDNPCKDEWIKDQEHLKKKFGEMIAEDMDFLSYSQS